MNHDELFPALDAVLLEVADGQIRPASALPTWFPAGLSTQSELCDAFPGLQAFLPDAEDFWERSVPGHVRSGMWTQRDASGQEMAFEARAVLASGGRFLFLHRADAEMEERRIAYQWARDWALVSERLERYRRDAERRSQVKTDFVATMTHELRTPLNAIIGFASLMQQSRGGELSERHREFVDTILTASHHLLAIINEVLDLSRVEAGRLELQIEPFAVGEVIKEVENSLRLLASRKPVSLTVNVPPLEVEGDRIRFRQVVYNLLNNAIKFTPPGGSVRVDVEDGGGEFRLSVSDTGPGVPVAEQELIFQRFYRNPGGHSSTQEGSGLGLAIAKRMVEAHGGSIRVENLPGSGARFLVTMPVRVHPAPGSKEAPAPDSLPPNLRVAIVEDNPAHALLLRAVLEPRHRVSVDPTGEEALARFQREKPDVVVLDFALPGMNGTEVLERMRASDGLKNVPVVAVSAVAAVDERGRSLAERSDEFVAKPFHSPQVILAAVARALRRRPMAAIR